MGSLEDNRLTESFKREVIPVEELQKDVDYFEHLLDNVHPHPIPGFPLGDVQFRTKDLRDSLFKPLTHLAFYEGLAPVISQIHDEHVRVRLPDALLKKYSATHATCFPLDVQFVGKRLYVADNRSDNAEIRPGAEGLCKSPVSRPAERQFV